MLKIDRNTKIFVFCPGDHVTGGTELLHQLVDRLNKYLLDAYIIYTPNTDAKIPDPYSHYNIKTANTIIDDSQNIIVFSEGGFDNAFEIKKAQIILWWLSVDNFFYQSTHFLSIYDYLNWNVKFGLNLFMCRIAALILKWRNPLLVRSVRELKNLNVVNCYQSEYARLFLLTKGFSKLFKLSDYINSEFVKPNLTLKREDIVLYNPKKGLKYTQSIIEAASFAKWIPLIGLTRQELLNTFNKSKLYIDFGNHPGKDRIPREAALNGCCVITGLKGSAKFFEDVSIPSKYKIDEKRTSVSDIAALIQEIIINYESHINDFAYYRNNILREEKEFEYQIKCLFNLIK